MEENKVPALVLLQSLTLWNIVGLASVGFPRFITEMKKQVGNINELMQTSKFLKIPLITAIKCHDIVE